MNPEDIARIIQELRYEGHVIEERLSECGEVEYSYLRGPDDEPRAGERGELR